MTLLVNTTTAEWMAAWGTVAAAAFAFAATVVAVWQLPRIRKQLTLAAETNVSQAYAVVAERSAVLRGILAENHAALYHLFYEDERTPREKEREEEEENAPLNPPPNQNELNLVCEAIIDFADVCIEQRKSVAGADMDWSTWDAYFRYLYQNSEVLRKFLRGNLDFYPDYVTAVFGYIVVRDECTGEVKSEWAVGEKGESTTYPWMRTWVITNIGGKATLEAEIRPRGTRSSTIDVQFTWRNDETEAEVKDPSEPVLHSWVLSQLKASTRLRTANIIVEGEERPRSARLGSITRSRRVWMTVTRQVPRERFLAPNIRTRSFLSSLKELGSGVQRLAEHAAHRR